MLPLAADNRGSGKSQGFCTMLLIKAMESPIRILCTRELQTSIKDSVHKLLSDLIDTYQLPGFKVLQNSIRHENGSEFIFRGLKSNASEIKSMANIDLCFIEEASSISHNSWNLLTPTIRKPGSEIWLVFNPSVETDIVYEKFVKDKNPADSIVMPINWDDNPFFPEVLRKEMEEMKKKDFDLYRHVWEGQLYKVAHGLPVFKGYFNRRIHVGKFLPDLDKELILGMDFGNTTSIVLCQEDRDKNLIVLQHLETKGLKTDQAAEQCLHFIKNQWHWKNPQITVYCDTAGNSQHSSAYQSDYDMLRNLNLHPVSSQKKGLIIPGIDLMKGKFATITSGFPGIMIDESCEKLIEALEIGYCYPKNEPSDLKPENRLPRKDGVYDHCIDSLRMICVNRYSIKPEINTKINELWDEYNQNSDNFDYFD